MEQGLGQELFVPALPFWWPPSCSFVLWSVTHFISFFHLFHLLHLSHWIVSLLPHWSAWGADGAPSLPNHKQPWWLHLKPQGSSSWPILSVCSLEQRPNPIFIVLPSSIILGGHWLNCGHPQVQTTHFHAAWVWEKKRHFTASSSSVTQLRGTNAGQPL